MAETTLSRVLKGWKDLTEYRVESLDRDGPYYQGDLDTNTKEGNNTEHTGNIEEREVQVLESLECRPEEPECLSVPCLDLRKNSKF